MKNTQNQRSDKGAQAQQDKRNYSPPTNGIRLFLTELVYHHKNPNTLPNDIQMKKNEHNEDGHEHFVVSPSYTRVHVYTVMVEALCTSVASFAVIASNHDIRPTQNTVLNINFLEFSVPKALIDDAAIHRIISGDADVVYCNENEQEEVNCEHDVKNRMVNSKERADDKGRMKYENDDHKYEGDYLLGYRFEVPGCDRLVLAFPWLQGWPTIVIVIVIRHEVLKDELNENSNNMLIYI